MIHVIIATPRGDRIDAVMLTPHKRHAPHHTLNLAIAWLVLLMNSTTTNAW